MFLGYVRKTLGQSSRDRIGIQDSQECTLHASLTRSACVRRYPWQESCAKQQRQQLRIYSLNSPPPALEGASHLDLLNEEFPWQYKQFPQLKKPSMMWLTESRSIYGSPYLAVAIYWWISFYLISFDAVLATQLFKLLYFHRGAARERRAETQFPTLLLFAFHSPAFADIYIAATPTNHLGDHSQGTPHYTPHPSLHHLHAPERCWHLKWLRLVC